jgi:hypothetical protein
MARILSRDMWKTAVWEASLWDFNPRRFTTGFPAVLSEISDWSYHCRMSAIWTRNTWNSCNFSLAFCWNSLGLLIRSVRGCSNSWHISCYIHLTLASVWFRSGENKTSRNEFLEGHVVHVVCRNGVHRNMTSKTLQFLYFAFKSLPTASSKKTYIIR